MENNTFFNAQVEKYYAEVDCDFLRFAIEQSEKNQTEASAANDFLDSKALSIMPFSLAGSGYLFVEFVTGFSNHHFLYLTGHILASLILVVASIFAVLTFWSKEFVRGGTRPSLYFADDIVGKDKGFRLKAALIAQLKANEKGILTHEINNKKKAANLKRCLFLSCGAVVIWALFLFLSLNLASSCPP